MILSRGWGRAPTAILDAPMNGKTGPTIRINQDYWEKFTAALKDSRALDSRVTPDDGAEVVDAEFFVDPDAEPPR